MIQRRNPRSFLNWLLPEAALFELSSPDQCGTSMHEAVVRLVSDLESLFTSNKDREAQTIAGHRLLMAFIGRAAVADERFLPSEEILPVLRDARTALAEFKCEGPAHYIRIDLSRELERAFSAVLAVRLRATE